ncbi:MAG: hypothetical protein P1V97_01230 [Planctomycetota bacterium]|nr:hypothetical protein [Planctomycetota bacterium]
MRQYLKHSRQQMRKSERGGAFTFTVLAASMVLLALGGAFMTPARHTLAMNGVQYHKLVAKSLGESGLDWALAQDLKTARKETLELGSGKVLVSITPQANGATILCISEPSKTRYRTAFKYNLTATVIRINGKTKISGIESSYTEAETDGKKDEKKDEEKKEGKRKF